MKTNITLIFIIILINQLEVFGQFPNPLASGIDPTTKAWQISMLGSTIENTKTSFKAIKNAKDVLHNAKETVSLLQHIDDITKQSFAIAQELGDFVATNDKKEFISKLAKLGLEEFIEDEEVKKDLRFFMDLDPLKDHQLLLDKSGRNSIYNQFKTGNINNVDELLTKVQKSDKSEREMEKVSYLRKVQEAQEYQSLSENYLAKAKELENKLVINKKLNVTEKTMISNHILNLYDAYFRYRTMANDLWEELSKKPDYVKQEEEFVKESLMMSKLIKDREGAKEKSKKRFEEKRGSYLGF